MKQPTEEDQLSRRTYALASSQVSTIIYCNISSQFGVFTHHTKIGDMFNTREAPFAANMTQALLDKDIDPLKVMVNWCRAYDVDLFLSMRMNDKRVVALPKTDAHGELDAVEATANNIRTRQQLSTDREAVKRSSDQGSKAAAEATQQSPSVDREMMRELKRLRQRANAPDLPPAVKRTGKV